MMMVLVLENYNLYTVKYMDIEDWSSNKLWRFCQNTSPTVHIDIEVILSKDIW